MAPFPPALPWRRRARREVIAFGGRATVYLPGPNGWRVSGEPRSEAQGRVRCTRGLGRTSARIPVAKRWHARAVCSTRTATTLPTRPRPPNRNLSAAVTDPNTDRFTRQSTEVARTIHLAQFRAIPKICQSTTNDQHEHARSATKSPALISRNHDEPYEVTQTHQHRHLGRPVGLMRPGSRVMCRFDRPCGLTGGGSAASPEAKRRGESAAPAG